ncbi:uncharacterized protein [Rutidosis leptorrhynchoides]|uniref:uncharacterized protein n=1 Tax=Rutidosis leptorrhynchoides TaxID=125765 RepID=UPI003A997FD1
MNDKRYFKALDRSLRDILGNTEEFFGGKSVILGGDFKQTLPIQTKGGKSAILGACIMTSHLWQRFKVFILAENMRLLTPGLTPSMRVKNAEFSKWLLRVGNGEIGLPNTEDPLNSHWVQIPDQFCIPDD